MERKDQDVSRQRHWPLDCVAVLRKLSRSWCVQAYSALSPALRWFGPLLWLVGSPAHAIAIYSQAGLTAVNTGPVAPCRRTQTSTHWVAASPCNESGACESVFVILDCVAHAQCLLAGPNARDKTHHGHQPCSRRRSLLVVARDYGGNSEDAFARVKSSLRSSGAAMLSDGLRPSSEHSRSRPSERIATSTARRR